MKADTERLRAIKTLSQLIAYLRDELDWPIDQDSTVDDISFDYSPEEMGLGSEYNDIIHEIKQIRPLDSKQPWGIFWVSFKKKRLPVVMMRRILGHLVRKNKAKKSSATSAQWDMHDLLFISSYGEEHERAITFAHFCQIPERPDDLPVLRVLGWDDGDTVLHLADVHEKLESNLNWPKNTNDLNSWRKRWAEAFTVGHLEVVRTTEEMVRELARLATAIRKRTGKSLDSESEKGPMRKLYKSFKELLIHDLSEDDFTDVIAQTVTYGLLIARLSSESNITVQNMVEMVPPTNPFLRDLLGSFLHIAGRRKMFDFDELGIQDVVDLMNNANAEAIKNDFGNKTRGEDPVIHFYEHFLAAYNKKLKVQRGVFYTPQPVVSYIVRSVHELLQTEFGLEDGLASTVTWGDMLKKNPELKLPPLTDEHGEKRTIKPDEPFVQILDPATGTATFLVAVIDVIYNHLKEKWDKSGIKNLPVLPDDCQLKTDDFSAYWNAYVPKALLPRLHGYELMMAPYAIAHMKIGLKLHETGYKFGNNERARIYLTNALEPAIDQPNLPDAFPVFAHEAQAVNDIKRNQRFTVVIGNPPYSNLSANLSLTARALVEPYKFINGERIRERGALSLEKNLNDDYVKFIRFSQITIHSVGIVGLVTNNGFVGNPTLRGMRHSLINAYRDFYIFNLLGYAGSSTRTSSAIKDENVFDIANAGVAIHVGLRKANSIKAKMLYAEIIGSREVKNAYLTKKTIRLTSFSPVSPEAPFFLMEPVNAETKIEYECGIPLLSLFGINSTGIRTLRDAFVVDFDEEPLLRRISKFKDSKASDETLCSEMHLEMPAWWRVSASRRSISNEKNIKQHVKQLSYRPFDIRKIFYHDSLVGSPRRPVMRHMEPREDNIALHICRQLSSPTWQHVLVTRGLTDDCYVSNRTKERGYTIPLSLRAELEELGLCDRPLNCDLIHFQKLFVSQDADAVNANNVLGYVYSVLHSPTYRTRYLDFLKRDFPRIPLTSSLDLFRELGCLGGELVSLHLMEFNVAQASRLCSRSGSESTYPLLTKFLGSKDPVVEKVSYSDSTVWIDKAKTIGFDGVPENVWNFHIGGYQVCEKWLKDRKGRTLSAEDIQHYHKIVVALNETIRIMAEIDVVIEKHGGWPGAFNTQTKTESKPEKVMYFPKEESEFPLAAEKKDEYGKKN